MRNGFTVVETLGALLVLSVLAAASYPILRGYKEYGLAAAVEVVASDIRKTRISAMTGGSPRAVIFEKDSSAYLYDVNTFAAGSGAGRDLGEIETGISLSGGEVAFNSLGEPVGPDLSVAVSAGGLVRKLRIEAYTGKVAVE